MRKRPIKEFHDKDEWNFHKPKKRTEMKEINEELKQSNKLTVGEMTFWQLCWRTLLTMFIVGWVIPFILFVLVALFGILGLSITSHAAESTGYVVVKDKEDPLVGLYKAMMLMQCGMQLDMKNELGDEIYSEMCKLEKCIPDKVCYKLIYDEFCNPVVEDVPEGMCEEVSKQLTL
jgi:hypothetical protein